jgi:hypothetical protein
VAVGNDAGGEPVFGKLLPQVIRVARKGGVGAIAQVSGQAGFGDGGVPDLLGCRRGVADSDEEALRGQCLDECQHHGPLRRRLMARSTANTREGVSCPTRWHAT